MKRDAFPSQSFLRTTITLIDHRRSQRLMCQRKNNIAKHDCFVHHPLLFAIADEARDVACIGDIDKQMVVHGVGEHPLSEIRSR